MKPTQQKATSVFLCRQHVLHVLAAYLVYGGDRLEALNHRNKIYFIFHVTNSTKKIVNQ